MAGTYGYSSDWKTLFALAKERFYEAPTPGATNPERRNRMAYDEEDLVPVRPRIRPSVSPERFSHGQSLQADEPRPRSARDRIHGAIQTVSNTVTALKETEIGLFGNAMSVDNERDRQPGVEGLHELLLDLEELTQEAEARAIRINTGV